jgi:hypothetical protein
MDYLRSSSIINLPADNPHNSINQMKNRDLIELLKQHDPNAETGIECVSISGNRNSLSLNGYRQTSVGLRNWDQTRALATFGNGRERTTAMSILMGGS